MTELSAEDLKFAQQALARLKPFFMSCTVPIIAGTLRRGAVGGTGTLFRIGPFHFLVTAAHVVTQRTADTLLAAPCGSGDARLLTLPDIAFALGEPYDVAVIPLAPLHVAAMAEKLSFLNLGHVARTPPDSRDALHAFHGFPVDTSKLAPETLYTDSIRAVGRLATDEVGTSTGFHSRHHVLVRMDRLDNGLPRSLKGVSGCSLWRLEHDPARRDSWSADDARVIAVETSDYPSASRVLVRATRWRYVLSLIADHFPATLRDIEISNSVHGFRIERFRSATEDMCPFDFREAELIWESIERVNDWSVARRAVYRCGGRVCRRVYSYDRETHSYGDHVPEGIDDRLS